MAASVRSTINDYKSLEVSFHFPFDLHIYRNLMFIIFRL